MVSLYDSKLQKRYDVIIVLGAKVLLGGKPSKALQCRIQRAVELFYAGYAPHLLVSGGGRSAGYKEAWIMKSMAVSQGVPVESIFSEETSGNTMQNAAASVEIMRTHRWHSAVIVTDQFHLRRAILAFKCFGMTVDAMPSAFDVMHTGTLRCWYLRLREWLALVWYALRYHTVKLMKGIP